jgi:Zn-finger nucleic acid-binding protein
MSEQWHRDSGNMPIVGDALLCPGCGAPLPESAARNVTTCTFCGVSAAPPPRVVEVERVVQRVVVAPTEGTAGLACPRCGARLRDRPTRHTLLRGCGDCGGIWLDNDSVRRLRDVRDTEVEEAARTMVLVIRPMSQEQRTAELSCPECNVRMRRVGIPESIHSMDVCDQHGTWFDRSELPMFVRTFSEARAGEVGADDLAAAGVPTTGRGFFTDVFEAVFMLMSGR